MNDSDTEKLQIDLDRLGGWAKENAMKINPGKSKAVSFTRARVKQPLKYCLGDQRLLEASSCKYLGIIIRRARAITQYAAFTELLKFFLMRST
jgi:hypothetical protein